MAYQKFPVAPPWKGWMDSVPPNVAEANSFSKIVNWLINKGRLQSSMNIAIFSSTPTAGSPLLGGRTFQDAVTMFHTLLIDQFGPSYWNGVAFQRLVQSPPATTVYFLSNVLYAIEVMYNKAFFCNGGAPLFYADGDGGYYLAGDCPGTSYFLGKLDSHLLMVNIIEPVIGITGSTRYPARIRWSASGNPFVWLINPATMLSEPTAGFIDIADVEDQLTGYATIGTTGYAFRNNGITTISVTGTLPPFKFENFSIGPSGIGCWIAYTLATYGNFCAFVAQNDIYYFDGSNAPQPIGGNAKRSIFKSLAQATGTPVAFMIGQLAQDFDFLSYWLVCLGPAGISTVWVYHFDGQEWMQLQLPQGVVTLLAQVAVL